MKILWISPTLPFPISAGNRRHLNYLVSFFKQKKSEIDFLLYGWEKEAEKNIEILNGMFNKFINIPQPTTKKMTEFDYWGIDDWISEDLMIKTSEIASQENYDLVIVEYVWLSKVFESFNKKEIKILDTHDVFSDRDFLFTSQKLDKSWFYTRRDQELKGLLRSDIILGITEEDCKFFSDMLANKKKSVNVIHCGSGIENSIPHKIENEKPDIKNKPIIIGYLASSNDLNKSAINRFLSQLNKFDLKNKNIFFNIGGSICNHIKSYSNIEIFKKGYIEDINKFYESVDLVIAPMINGTGLKIKSIEAIEKLKPIMANRQATNDIPVSSALHSFGSIEIFASYFGKWLLSSEKRRYETLTYLKEESFFLRKKIKEKQSNFEDYFWLVLNQKQQKQQKQKHKHSKKVSVIIPCYNTEKYIERCINSILKDRIIEEIEIILIDDGSTDKTYDILLGYRNKFPETIVLIKQNNAGQGVARNKGIDISRGEYLYFIDSDDYIGENSLFYMYEMSKSENLDICSPDRDYLLSRPIKAISALPGWCCFIKKEILQKIPNFEIRQPKIKSGQDGVFANMLLTQCTSSNVCRKAKYFYEKRSDSTFNSLTKTPELIPEIVELHLKELRNFYYQNKPLAKEENIIRFYLFIQDETYKFRYKNNLIFLSNDLAKRIYLSIKTEICSNKDFNKITKSSSFFNKDFLDIANLTYEEHRIKYA